MIAPPDYHAIVIISSPPDYRPRRYVQLRQPRLAEKISHHLGMISQALPPPTNDGTTMVLVCGTDGFVETWAGPIARGPRLADGSKGPKVQGPLLGLLAAAGYDASEVFKY